MAVKRVRIMLVGLVLVGLVTGGGEARERSYRFTAVDYPGSVATVVNGVNARGDLVGSYVLPNGSVHGFLLSRGAFQTIDVPGALMTEARGINAQGDIVGSYNEDFTIPGFGFRGFLLKQGVLTRIDFPGHLNTILENITSNGLIVGCFHDAGTDVPPLLTMAGITFDGTEFTSFDLFTSMHKASNANGSLVLGEFWDFDMNTERGYLLDRGRFEAFDFPGGMFTMPWDMNQAGEIVGMYMDDSGATHGFAGKLGEFVSVDYPASAGTTAFGISPNGVVVGSYSLGGLTHGFVARPLGQGAAEGP